MHPFQAQIDRETAKVKLLRDKIEECEKRIAMYRSVQDSDALDRLLDQELRAAAPPAPAQTTPAPVDDIKPRRKRLPENWLRLLAFIGEEGKSSDQVRAFLKANPTIGITPDASRTGLMNYRKEYGLVESPRRGFYKLSQLGVEAVSAQQSESPDIWR